MTDARVVIVGAGPSGLAAALFLTRAGVPVTVLESRTEIYEDPRAATIHLPDLVVDLADADTDVHAHDPQRLQLEQHVAAGQRLVRVIEGPDH